MPALVTILLLAWQAAHSPAVDAQRVPQTVSAQSFVLQDQAGEVRAILGVENQTGAVQLQLFGGPGGSNPEVGLEAAGDHAALTISGLGPSSSVDLYAGSLTGSAGLINVHDANGSIIWSVP